MKSRRAVDNTGMDADEYLKRYLPDFDTDEKRSQLQEYSREDLVEMLLVAYKNVRVMAMTADVLQSKLSRIEAIADEPSLLPSVDVPPPNFPKE